MQKQAKFSSAGGFYPRRPASGGWGLRPQTHKTATPHCKLATRLALAALFYLQDKSKSRLNASIYRLSNVTTSWRAEASLAEVESSRTHFEVLGLGLEASSPSWP